MSTNNEGESDIVTHQTNIRNKAYSVKRIFLYKIVVAKGVKLPGDEMINIFDKVVVQIGQIFLPKYSNFRRSLGVT